jgi:hypothetical protein
VRAVLGGDEEAERAGTDGAGDEARQSAGQLGREDLTVEPAQALHRGVGEGAVEEDRRLAQHVVVGKRRERDQRAVEVELEVGADHRSGGQRLFEAGRGEVVLEDARRGHGAGGEDHRVGAVVGAVAADHALDPLRRAGRMEQADHLLPGQQGEVGQVCHGAEEVALGVGLIAGDRGIAIEVPGLVLVLQDLGLEAERQRLIAPARAVAGDAVDQRLQLGLVGEAVDVEQPLRLVVVRRQLVQPERPGEALMLGIGLELVGRKAQQRRAVPLGLAADVVELVGHQMAAAAVPPRLLVLELPLLEHLQGVERAAVGRQVAALLQHQHAAAGARQAVGGSRPARPGADDDRVISWGYRASRYLSPVRFGRHRLFLWLSRSGRSRRASGSRSGRCSGAGCDG